MVKTIAVKNQRHPSIGGAAARVGLEMVGLVVRRDNCYLYIIFNDIWPINEATPTQKGLSGEAQQLQFCRSMVVGTKPCVERAFEIGRFVQYLERRLQYILLFCHFYPVSQKPPGRGVYLNVMQTLSNNFAAGERTLALHHGGL
jgi:hypothetical protein